MLVWIRDDGMLIRDVKCRSGILGCGSGMINVDPR